MIKNDGNGNFIIRKDTFTILSIVVSLLIVFAGIITYSVTAANNIDRVEQKVDMNKDEIDGDIIDLKTDITEIKSDVKMILTRIK